MIIIIIIIIIIIVKLIYTDLFLFLDDYNVIYMLLQLLSIMKYVKYILLTRLGSW